MHFFVICDVCIVVPYSLLCMVIYGVNIVLMEVTSLFQFLFHFSLSFCFMHIYYISELYYLIIVGFINSSFVSNNV